MYTYKHTVVPGEYGELIQASDEIPAGSDISKEEDSDCEYRERLHLLEAWDRGRGTFTVAWSRSLGDQFVGRASCRSVDVRPLECLSCHLCRVV